MIADIGPADWNYEQTLSTLRYANRAKSITNTSKINEDPKDAMLRECSEEIQRLKAQIENVGPNARAISKIVTTKKIISVEDREKLKELELRLQKEKEEAENKIHAEIKKNHDEKTMAETDKLKVLEHLKKKEKEQKKQTEKQKKLLKRFKEVKKMYYKKQ